MNPFSWFLQLDGFDWWIITVAALTGVCCALPGTFMVLRRMSMMSDAISHTVLPGIAIAFLLTGSRDYPVMLTGAAVLGVLTALATQALHRWGRVESSAATGVVFTSLFALGLVLIERGARYVDLDPGCVLYGSLDMAPMDEVSLLGWPVPRALVVLLTVLLVDVLVIAAFFKEIRLVCFDPDHARALGIPAQTIHLGLMALVAITTVAAFELVGSIMVVALLIVPGATAWLWTNRLIPMLLVAMLLGALAGPLGFAVAYWLPPMIATEALPFSETGAAGGVAVACGLLFVGSWMVAPQQGLVPRWWRRRAIRRRHVQEDVLGILFRLDEAGERHAPQDLVPLLANALHLNAGAVRRALRAARSRGAVFAAGGGWQLTEAGRLEGRRLVRSHRLWEAYIQKYLGLRADHLHAPANRLEHHTDTVMIEAMQEALDNPEVDPHGRKMP